MDAQNLMMKCDVPCGGHGECIVMVRKDFIYFSRTESQEATGMKATTALKVLVEVLQGNNNTCEISQYVSGIQNIL